VKFTCWKGVVTCIESHGSEDGLFKFLKCRVYMALIMAVNKQSPFKVHHGWVCILRV
jgi:hypothetical protein